MRNLTGYLTKQRFKFRLRPILFLLLIIQLAFTPFTASAQYTRETLDTEAQIFYTIQQDGTLETRILYSFINRNEAILPLRIISLNLPFVDLEQVSSNHANKYYPVTIQQQEGSTVISVDLENTILRENSRLALEVRFLQRGIFESTPKFIALPSRLQSASVLKVVMELHSGFSEPTSQQSNSTITQTSTGYRVTVLNPLTPTTSILFSDQILFKYSQKNRLTNYDSVSKYSEVMIPISDDSQTLLPSYISHQPDLTFNDVEGNMILRYMLLPNESKEIHISGYIVKDINKKSSLSTISSPQYTTTLGYWSIDTQVVDNLVKQYGLQQGIQWQSISVDDRSSIINAILSTVSDRLSLPTSESDESRFNYRVGATILSNGYEQAYPQDYVDFTIALLRSFNIPSRQIIGFSEQVSNINSALLTHTWVEYWDPTEGWLILDPYLNEIVSGNRSSFSAHDRITIMGRGLDPNFPQFTSFSLTEMNISISNDDLIPVTQINASSPPVVSNLLSPIREVPVYFENTGSTIINSIKILKGGKQLTSNDAILLPGSKTTIYIPYSGIMGVLEADGQNFVNISVRSINGDLVSSDIELDILNVSPWWWSYFIIILSAFSYLLTLYFLWSLSSRIYFRVYRK